MADRDLRLDRKPFAQDCEIARHAAPGAIAATGLRRSGGRIETTELSLQPPLGSAYYISESFAKEGDSGGPVYVVGPSGHRIVIAVTAGISDSQAY